MEEKNTPHKQVFQDWLRALVRAPEDHVRFLNMLSMLEHMGSRKIMLSQMDKILTHEILKHLAEETRHAYFFKRQAEKIAKQDVDDYTAENTMCLIPAKMYFGRLDATLTKSAPQSDHPESGYLWVSLIIELRACWLYHMYQEVLEEAGIPISLKSVIAEEDMHLQDMYSRLQELIGVDSQDLSDMCALETALFAKFWHYLKSEFPYHEENMKKSAENLIKAA